jgi:predicted SnoaL-like aldol condensation-catalyzing enzyme
MEDIRDSVPRDRKTAAVDFLERIVDGDIEEAFKRYADPKGKHHNPFTPAGFEALKKGMQDAHRQFPHKEWEILHVLLDGDLVAIHGHMVLVPGKTDLATLHLVRFEGNWIVEFWDMAQAIPDPPVNQDGMF